MLFDSLSHKLNGSESLCRCVTCAKFDTSMTGLCSGFPSNCSFGENPFFTAWTCLWYVFWNCFTVPPPPAPSRLHMQLIWHASTRHYSNGMQLDVDVSSLRLILTETVSVPYWEGRLLLVGLGSLGRPCCAALPHGQPALSTLFHLHAMHVPVSEPVCVPFFQVVTYEAKGTYEGCCTSLALQGTMSFQ